MDFSATTDTRRPSTLPIGRTDATRAAVRPKTRSTRMPNSAQLEFYPGAHVLIWVVDGKPTVWVQAWGGSDPIPGWDDGGMTPKKTTRGRFIIHSRGRTSRISGLTR